MAQERSSIYKLSEEIDKLTKDFYNSTIGIIIEKDCGYKFSIYLHENATLKDIYRYVSYYYPHLIAELSIDDNIIPRIEMPIKDYVRNHNMKPAYPYPLKMFYKFYLEFH